MSKRMESNAEYWTLDFNDSVEIESVFGTVDDESVVWAKARLVTLVHNKIQANAVNIFVDISFSQKDISGLGGVNLRIQSYEIKACSFSGV